MEEVNLKKTATALTRQEETFKVSEDSSSDDSDDSDPSPVKRKVVKKKGVDQSQNENIFNSHKRFIIVKAF